MSELEWDFFDRVVDLAREAGSGPADEFPARFPRVLPKGMQVLTGLDYDLSSDAPTATLTATMASRERLNAAAGANLDSDTYQAMAEEVAVALAYATLQLLSPDEFSDVDVSVMHEQARDEDRPMAYVADDRNDLGRTLVRRSNLSRFEQVGGVASPWVTRSDRLRELRERVAARRAAEEPAPAPETHQSVRRFPPQRSEERLGRIAELRARIESGERSIPLSSDGRAALAASPERPDPQTLHPREFELLVKRLLEAMGLTAKETPYSKDDGVDVVAEDRRPFHRGRVVVQAKRYAGSVGVTTVRELNGVLPIHRAQRGIIVTTGSFTREAVTTARQLGIELVDGVELRQALAEHLPQ